MAIKPPPAWLAWAPVIATLSLVGGNLMATGGKINQVDDDHRRIGVVETKSDAISDKLDKINERTARIEAKLELLQPEMEGRK